MDRLTVARRGLACVLAAVLGIAVLSGCGGSAVADDPPDAAHSGALAIVVGARANSAPPALTGAARSALDLAAAQQSHVSVVVADGAPFVADARRLALPDGTQQERQEHRELNRQWVERAVTEARARTPESDLLGALQVAVDSIRDMRGHRSIVVLDSGLSTTGALDFTEPDLLDAVPREVADSLGTTQRLPALAGMSVHFIGLGNTAEPQEPPDRVRLEQLQEMWTTVAETAGASLVEVEEAPPVEGDPADGLPAVTPVPMPRGYSCDGTVMTITGGVLSFRPYTDAWFDPATAEAVLEPIAEQVKAGMLTVTLEGTAADVRSESEQLMLSYLQPQAIADMWLESDVPVQLLTVVGLGSDFPGRLSETTPEGGFDAIAAETNRKITLTFSGPVTC